MNAYANQEVMYLYTIYPEAFAVFTSNIQGVYFNPFLLYPDQNLNGGATLPQPGADGIYPLSVWLKQEQVGTPLGADTLFLMATAEKVSDPSLLVSDGVLGTRGGGGRSDELISGMSDAGTRGPVTVPTNWLVQQHVLSSRPASRIYCR